MTEIKKLIDGSGSQYYPQTHTKAVIDDQGNSVESVLQAQTDIINAKQFEQGDVEWDIYPTTGSYGKVASSGGIKHALDNKVDIDGVMQSHSWDLSDGGDFVWIIGTIQGTKAHNSSSYYHVNIPVAEGLKVKLKANSSYGIEYAFLKDIDFTYVNNGVDITDHFANGYVGKITVAIDEEVTFTIPEGCSYLYMAVGQKSGNSFIPAENHYYTPKWDEDINALAEKAIPRVPLSTVFTNDYGVEYDTGELVYNSVLAYSEYIDVHAYDVVNIGIFEPSLASGYALYDENKQYISGGHGSGLSWEYTNTDIDTSEAYYLRLTSVSPTNSHFAEMGYPHVVAVSNVIVANNLDVTDAGYVLDARQGKVLADFIKEGALMIDTSQFVWSYGFINSSGNVDTSDTLTQYSGYVELDASFKKIITSWLKGSSVRFGAFYDSNKSFISYFGNTVATVNGYDNGHVVDIPDDAVYVRLTRYSDTSTYGQIQFGYKNDAANSDDIANAISEKMDAVVGADTKIANPYFQTFASNGSLTKETIFSTSVDSGGGNTRRIPSVVVTNAKTIIAATEVRSAYTDNAQTGIILARKTSDANSWTYNFVLPYNAESYGKVMNPCFVVDRSGAHGTTGRIYLFFIAFQITSNNDGWAYLCTSSEIDNMYVYSDDDGVTWSSPASTKSAWDTDSYNWMGVSPANGALMSDGTFVLPCMGYKGSWYSGIMYKTPSGSWTYSNKTSAAGDNESAVFVYDGKAYLNCRNESNGHTRTLYKLDTTSNKMEKVDYNYDPNLICQQSICNGTIGGNSTFFQTSNDPLTYNTRNRLTVWASKNGMKWARLIRVNDGTTYGYSVADCYDGKLVMVYENSGTISCIDLSSMATTIGTVYSKVLGKPLEDRLHELIEKLLAE